MEDNISVISSENSAAKSDLDLSNKHQKLKEREVLDIPIPKNKYVHPGAKFFQLLGLPTFDADVKLVEDSTLIEKVKFWYGLLAFPATAFGIVYVFIITLIPYRNQIYHPSSWYELAILVALYPLMFTIDAIIQCYYTFNAEYMVSFSSMLRLYIPTALLGLIPYCVSIVIWTFVLEFNPPLPITPMVLNLGVITFVSKLYLDVVAKNKEKGDRKRIVIFLMSLVYLTFVFFTYNGINIMKEMMPPTFEWLVAIVLPIIREIHSFVGSKLLLKSKPLSPDVMLFQLYMGIKCFHEFYVVLFLASVQLTTVYTILGIEFILHVYSCFTIIVSYKKIAEARMNMENARKMVEIRKTLSRLVLDETLEIFVPFCYLVTFLSAYYGPNAFILGNIRNDYWDFVAVEDVGNVVAVGFQMFGIDVGITLFTAATLYAFCKISLFDEFCKLMKTYWSWMGIRIALILFRVRIRDYLGCIQHLLLMIYMRLFYY